jgi:hypothetical protein
MPDKQQLHDLVDQLPVSEIAAALRFLEFLLSQEAPVDPEMLTRIDKARANPSAGIPHEAVMREFGLRNSSSGSPPRQPICAALTARLPCAFIPQLSISDIIIT